MPKPTRLGRADAQKRIAAGSEVLRTAGRAAPSWRRTDNPDGTISYHAADGEHLFDLAGMWALPVAVYLDAVHPIHGVGFAELLWQLGGGGGDALSTAAGVADQIARSSRK
ncbi:hypothetical protein [Kutzneria buriramensis]|nr:hypothetical protein [Kutzneria buriramensis]